MSWKTIDMEGSSTGREGNHGDGSDDSGLCPQESSYLHMGEFSPSN